MLGFFVYTHVIPAVEKTDKKIRELEKKIRRETKQ